MIADSLGSHNKPLKLKDCERKDSSDSKQMMATASPIVCQVL